MGQTDEIMMKTRPNTYVYTPITRGHKPTPSQESNTLSEVSYTTTVSMDSGPPLSPTYQEEDEENRLHDFRDEDEISGSRDSLNCSQTVNGFGGGDHHITVYSEPLPSDQLRPPLSSSACGGQCEPSSFPAATAATLPAPVNGDNVSESELNVSRPILRLSSGSNLSEESSIVSSGGRSELGEPPSFRDSCDTVVKVEIPDLGSNGMPREAKSANSDYGSFCTTPTGGEGGNAATPRPLAPTSSTPYQQVQNISDLHSDTSINLGDPFQRAPLLSDSEAEEDIAGGGQQTPVSDRSSSAAPPPKLTSPPPPRGAGTGGDPKIPGEPLKTLLSGLFLGTGFIATTSSLAVTHESVPDIDPLPDIILDNVSYQQWGLDVSEILIMVSTFSAFLVVVLHYHRLIILRRVWFLLGCLYYYRAITMFITVLPKADVSYTCNPKLDNTTALPALVILKRVLILMSGMGLSINGKHIYCGDYIFSGHTMVLTMGYLVIKEYSPRRFFILHWMSFFTSLTGVIMLLIARGHYSIDCLIAYYITTRLWWIYHTLANNNNLKTRGNHNFFDQMWWWMIFRYFEVKIETPLPRKYSLPFPRRLKRFVRKAFRSLRRGRSGADTESTQP